MKKFYVYYVINGERFFYNKYTHEKRALNKARAINNEFGYPTEVMHESTGELLEIFYKDKYWYSKGR